MNPAEIQASVELIKASLRNRPSQNITGALLGELIRKTTPSLDLKVLYPTGQKALSRFVKDYLDGFLTSAGHQGGDVVYSINEIDPQCEESVTYEIWRSFVRPNSPYRLKLSTDHPEISLIRAGENSDDSIVIPSVNPTELAEIRREFTESGALPSNSIALHSADSPYYDWTMLIRQQGHKTFNAWSSFRIQSLHQLFTNRLSSSGIPDDLIPAYSDLLKQSQRNAPKKESNTPKSAVDGNNNPLTPSHLTNLGSEEDYRKIVSEAVNKMSIAELRELKIPTGLIMDAISAIFQK